MLRKYIAPAVPYLATIIGLWVCRSVWVAIIGYHAGMIIVLLLSKYGLPFKRLFQLNDYEAAIVPAIAGALGGRLLRVLWPFLFVPADFPLYVHQIGLTSAIWPLFIVYYAAVNPFLEELYWRGYLGSGLRRLTVNDLLFSGYHLFVLAGKMSAVWLAVAFVLLSLVAWYWRRIDRSSGGLFPSVASHFAADLTIIIAVFRMSGV